MKKTVKTAGVQLAPSDDGAENLRKAGALIALAADEGARIITLPQLFNVRWFPSHLSAKNFALAETESGPAISTLRELASKKEAVLIASIFEKDGEDHFNTAFVIGTKGEIIGKYRKIHVPQIPLWEEKAYFRPGNLGFPVFDTPFCRIGVQICWDIFFPEGMRILALKGAQAIFVPTASAFEHSHRKWERAIMAAAHSNGVFITRVNRVGREERQEFYGKSFCAGPDGEFVDNPAGPSAGVVLAELDLGEIGRVRNEWVFLRDRRPQEYKEILEG